MAVLVLAVVVVVVVVVGFPLHMYSQLETRALSPLETPYITMPAPLLYTQPVNCTSLISSVGVPLIPRYAKAVLKHWSLLVTGGMR